MIDASISLAWCFEDEVSEYADAVGSALQFERAQVPAIWMLEIGNAFTVAERRGRIIAADTTRYLAVLSALPIDIDPITWRSAFDGALPLARMHALSVYDSSYIELALRLGLPLATLDLRLRSAAVAAGAVLFTP